MSFLAKNSLNLITGLGVLVLIFAIFNWSTMPILQRVDAVFFLALIAHLWEEGRFPGGFTDLVTAKLNFTQSNPHFGEFITATYVLLLTFVPLLFTQFAFLGVAALLIWLLEGMAHVAAARVLLKGWYSPGMATAVSLLLPISIYGIAAAQQNHLISPLSWLFAFLYLIIGLALAQQIVVRASGMKYADFLRNERAAFTGGPT